MHVHAIPQDLYERKAWVYTGNRDQESMIAWTDDSGKTLNPTSQGSQVWRVTQLVFTESALYWGTEIYSLSLSGIYNWDRRKRMLSKLVDVEGAIIYGIRLAGGTIVLSTNREGAKTEEMKIFDCG